MTFKKLKPVIATTLAAGLLLSMAIPSYPLAAKQEAISYENVKSMLKELSAEERRALNELTASPTFAIAPDVKQDSSEVISVIVEFKTLPAKVAVKQQTANGKRMLAATAETQVEQSHQDFKKFVSSFKKQKNIKDFDPATIEINREYKNAINGVSMKLPGIAVKELLASDEVKRVWSNKEIQLDLPEEKEVISPKMSDSVPQIGVDKLHDENITGKGIKVGVIDTGIDYNHPDLTESYRGYRSTDGEDPKEVDPESVKGWDFVDDDADPMETTYKDWQNSGDPEDYYGSKYYTSHGTHVSGTIAATKQNAVDYAVGGIAPDIDLYNYRVLGPYGSGSNEDVIAGIDKAVSDEMDVMNLSLGSSVNDPLDPTSIAINNAMLSGVVAVVAAGNAGPESKSLGSPGTAALGITVGASDSAMNIPTMSLATGKDTLSLMLLAKNFSDQLKLLEGKKLPIVSAGIGQASDFKGIDAKGKVALIERGTLTFDEKIANAKAAGAIATLIYNHTDGQISAYLGEGKEYIPSFRLSKEEGEKLKNSGLSTITLKDLSSTKTEGDQLADFSSRGPVNGNYDIKPDVVAPGVAIFSTIPEYINSPEEGIDYTTSYSRMQGTSMASPHVAGVAALILQSNEGYDPFDVKEALMNTSVDLKQNYSVNEVGAGRIDAYEAVHAETTVKVLDQTETVSGDENTLIDEETGSIAFGREYLRENNETISISKDIEVENRGKKKAYDITVKFNEGIKGVENAKENGVKLNIKNSITVGKGKTKTLAAAIKVPSQAKPGAYEGYIHFVNQDNQEESYQVPFSITVTDKGIDYLETDRPALANDIGFWQHYYPFINGMFALKSPMETIDVILSDGKTGKPLGYIGSLNAKNMVPDREYFLLYMFAGYMQPFTNDPENPIAEERLKLPEGDYKLDFIAMDESGKTYDIDTPAIVDNTAPEISWDKKPGVYELNDSMFTEEDGMEAFYVHGNVQDKTVDLLKEKGLDYDQSSNTMFYDTSKYAYFARTFPITENGDVKYGIEKSDIADDALYLQLATTDMATAVNQEAYIFLQEGTPYISADYNKESIKKNDTITMSLTLNNVKDLMSSEHKVSFYDDYYQFKNAKLSKEINQYAKQKGISVELKDPEVIKDEHWTSSVSLETVLSGKAFNGLNGDMPILDVNFKLVDDAKYNKYDAFEVIGANYEQKDNKTVTLPFYSIEKFEVISKHSTVEGTVNLEAFTSEEGYFNRTGDAENLGINLYAQTRSGKKYKGTIDSYGQFQVKGIPASSQEYTLVIEAPGHLKSSSTFIPGKMVDGELIGQLQRVRPALGLAGDVNGDKVIDIKDIRDAVDAYGDEDSSMKKEDINQDGKVDEADIRLIEKNFLAKGPDAGNKEPKETIGKKDLEYFLRLIELEPTNN
ncbi:S8 family serine peptidase [Cytobacillus purgationiresistens]|uniref:Subtilisin family serine protease n=1 Tax=Cytobacillus purgationiresistens TaxID=863449 RepID=A0ABU0AFN4_9BACI|nr:S8 family serine peptidase [Cytobacillus purgationiresistens]MDQ0270070.1 subtilisin family serine protease [Cytobacillus purgationiresistens]